MEPTRAKARGSLRAECPSGHNHPRPEGCGFRPRGIKGTVLFFNQIERRKNRTVPFIYNKKLFQIGINLALVITQYIFTLGLRKNIIWPHRDFPAAARAVNDIGRDSIAGGVAA